MKFLEKSMKGSLPSILIGVGAAIVAPVVLPAIGAVARPLAKRAIRGCLAVSDYFKEFASEARESLTDLVAEEKADRAAVKQIVDKAAESPPPPEGGSA
jgi:hypothetical protein